VPARRLRVGDGAFAELGRLLALGKGAAGRKWSNDGPALGAGLGTPPGGHGCGRPFIQRPARAALWLARTVAALARGGVRGGSGLAGRLWTRGGEDVYLLPVLRKG